MELHVNVLDISEKTLTALTHGKNATDSEHGRLKFVSRDLSNHASGFHSDVVVFKKGDKYFQFLATGYLDEAYWSYTKPYEVFKETRTHIRTTYTSWLKDVNE